MSTLYSIGQMNQLGDALEAAEFTPDDVTQLRSFSQLGRIRDVLQGRAEIVPTKHLIDCDADPYLPPGWQVEEHRKGGQLEWDPKNLTLYLSKKQRRGGYIKGYDLRKELEDEPVLNANVLDYLLSHSELIPDECKGKRVYFLGTVYRNPYGRLVVRCLYWYGGRWRWNCDWLDSDWDGDRPAALLAS